MKRSSASEPASSAKDNLTMLKTLLSCPFCDAGEKPQMIQGGGVPGHWMNQGGLYQVCLKTLNEARLKAIESSK